jgi:hypothetical protein
MPELNWAFFEVRLMDFTFPFYSRQMLLYLAAACVVVMVLLSLRHRFLLFSLLSLPGTAIHEGMHFLLALLFCARPVSVNLVPRREGNSYVMGYVACSQMHWYNAIFVGLAPLLMLPLALWTAQWRLEHWAGFRFDELAWVYLVGSMVHGCLPSTQDIKISLYSWPLFLAAGVAWWWLSPQHNLAWL